MRRLTQEEKNAFEKALLQTNGVNTHLFDIMLWTFFPRWRFWLFVDSLTSGMHWWAAYEKVKNTKKTIVNIEKKEIVVKKRLKNFGINTVN